MSKYLVAMVTLRAGLDFFGSSQIQLHFASTAGARCPGPCLGTAARAAEQHQPRAALSSLTSSRHSLARCQLWISSLSHHLCSGSVSFKAGRLSEQRLQWELCSCQIWLYLCSALAICTQEGKFPAKLLSPSKAKVVNEKHSHPF